MVNRCQILGIIDLNLFSSILTLFYIQILFRFLLCLLLAIRLVLFRVLALLCFLFQNILLGLSYYLVDLLLLFLIFFLLWLFINDLFLFINYDLPGIFSKLLFFVFFWINLLEWITVSGFLALCGLYIVFVIDCCLDILDYMFLLNILLLRRWCFRWLSALILILRALISILL